MNNSIDNDLLIHYVVSSKGDLPLAAERLTLATKQHVTEYDVQEVIASLDQPTADRLSAKLRTLLTVNLFFLVHQAGIELLGNLGNLRPAELARTHSSLVASFTAITAPATKLTFDFDAEAEKLATELGIPVETIKAEIKETQAKVSSK